MKARHTPVWSAIIEESCSVNIASVNSPNSSDSKKSKHIIRKRMTVNWKWGPVTSYAIPLDEIDTAGARARGGDGV